jgi:TM2 domain-containing membrane protein YozV|tara:strand:+ start:127 stop:504 length:378 start_codon:yes stop_codon:yes gene_type:complete
MKKSLVLLASILFGVSAYASIPIIDATATVESSGLMDVLMAAMDNETLIAALLCFFLGTLGIHWFYLGEKGKGFMRLGLFLGGYALSIVGALVGVPALALVGSLVILVDFVLAIMDLIKILTGKV